jgi:multidrug efflux pump subunit AcrA (membrane-fusion protein)
MFARAIINTYEKKDALIIPAASFKKKGQQYFIYIVHREAAEAKEGEEEAVSDSGTVEEREIEIGYLTYDMAEVSKGVKEGELIVRELHQEFKDKDQVEVTEVQETIF